MASPPGTHSSSFMRGDFRAEKADKPNTAVMKAASLHTSASVISGAGAAHAITHGPAGRGSAGPDGWETGTLEHVSDELLMLENKQEPCSGALFYGCS